MNSEWVRSLSHALDEYFTFLDAGIAPFVRQFRIPDKDWFDALPLPSLLKWLHDFMDSERFASVMQKYKLWDGEKAGIVFPFKEP